MPKLSLNLGYAHAHAGWMHCWLTIDGERHGIEASYVFPPFIDLLEFTKAVATQRLPARFEWDEEGHLVVFTATPLAENHPLVHLTIQYKKDEEPWLDADISRDEVVQAFLPPVLEFATRSRLAEAEWHTPRKAVERIQAFIEKGLPLRSDVNHPQRLDCIVSSEYNESYIDGNVFLKLVLFDEEKIRLQMHDTHPFWMTWFEFVGKVAHGDLPAQCEYVQTRIITDNLPPFILQVSFSAQAVANSDNFRFIVYRNWSDEEPFLIIDEVLNRRQFAQGFAKAFRDFLPHYRLTPNGEGQTFDLTKLPIEGLDGELPVL